MASKVTLVTTPASREKAESRGWENSSDHYPLGGLALLSGSSFLAIILYNHIWRGNILLRSCIIFTTWFLLLQVFPNIIILCVIESIGNAPWVQPALLSLRFSEPLTPILWVLLLVLLDPTRRIWILTNIKFMPCCFVPFTNTIIFHFNGK